MKLDRRAGDTEEINEDDELLELAGSPWERAFTRRFLKVESQQQQQTDIMRAGKLGFAALTGLSGLGASLFAILYYLYHLGGPK